MATERFETLQRRILYHWKLLGTIHDLNKPGLRGVFPFTNVVSSPSHAWSHLTHGSSHAWPHVPQSSGGKVQGGVGAQKHGQAQGRNAGVREMMKVYEHGLDEADLGPTRSSRGPGVGQEVKAALHPPPPAVARAVTREMMEGVGTLAQGVSDLGERLAPGRGGSAIAERVRGEGARMGRGRGAERAQAGASLHSYV